ncbi:MAG: serine hydrolase [Firmicutes bacterium]|nr:serine hydrolase [Bacillota bacterium]
MKDLLYNESRVLREASPVEAGFDAARLARAREVLARAVENGAFPGAVALVVRHGRIVLHEAVGKASLRPATREMTRETIFDLASVTKVVATLPSVMILLERGQLRLDDAVTRFIPEFGQAGKEGVLIRHLLTHTAGLAPFGFLYRCCGTREKILARICEYPLGNPVGTVEVYSDLGLIVLGEIVERVSGRPLDQFAQEEIFTPLGMADTRYRPPVELRGRIAATEDDPWRGRVLVGEVHDENAYAMGGVSGHAGLFSTAQDLAIYAQLFLNGGEYGGRRILSPVTIRRVTSRQDAAVPVSTRGLGWQIKDPTFASAGDLLSPEAYGHTGFTGTMIWIDPVLDLFIILLTNRVHPSRENDAILRVRPLFCNAVAGAIVE